MALKIKQVKDTFLLRGRINTTTVKQLKKHLEFLICYTSNLTLDVEHVKEIDAAGMKALRELYAYAIAKRKRLCFVGYGCKELHDDIAYTTMA